MGLLTVGKIADIVVVFKNNLFDIQVSKIHDVKVEMTIMNGSVTY